MSLRALLIAAALAVPLLAGCLSGPSGDDASTPTPDVLVPVQDRHLQPYDTEGPWSSPLREGPYAILGEVLDVFVPVEVPADEGGGGLVGTEVHMGVFLPDVPEGTLVPVIADIGPYYGEIDPPATEPANRLGRFLIENLVPHGYAVAQVSVLGTGQSGHCMDLMGRAEQAGVDAAVTWLGTQDWSNGNVGLIGRSYDGSTPWQAAMSGNEHLSTIVPISGLTGMHELMWRNGSAEFRAPIMHNVVYGAYGLENQADPAQRACRDYLTGPVHGLGAYVTGDHFLPAVNDYWTQRYFLDDVLDNYQGSVYFIHGLQDWNVDPHMAFPAHQRLEAAGIEVKGLYGQWGHHYPDRESEHSGLPDGRGQQAFPYTVRHDWAQDLLEWFDHYLKGTGPKPQIHTEVQDNLGAWRIEETYPPRDADRVQRTLADATPIHTGPHVVSGPAFLGAGGSPTLQYLFEPISDDRDTLIAGNVHFHVTVTPAGAGGQLFARLSDAETGLRLGHAIMDLRFHEGGNEAATVVPGMPIVARMEFQAMDVVLPAGHGLLLEVAPTGEDYLPSAVSNPVAVDASAASVLRIPVVERGPDAYFMPPGQDFPEHVARLQAAVAG